jgi:dTMP kinase
MRWIVVDGIDGSGKTTHARWIKEFYEAKGGKVMLRVHPSERFAGRMTRKALLGEGRWMRFIATLWFIADILNSLRALRKDGRRFDTVIYVRYLMATAYLPERCMRMGYDFFARLLPVPDRLLLVDIDPGIAHERIQARQEAKEMFEDPENLARARRKVLKLAVPPWMVMDNSIAAEKARAELLELLESWDEQFSR